jgi:hypothetical protein
MDKTELTYELRELQKIHKSGILDKNSVIGDRIKELRQKLFSIGE